MSTLRFAILSLCTLCLLVACDRPPAYDEEIKALDPELSELPKIRPNLLIPTVGFGSAMGKSAECEAWIDIVLPQPRSFDTIALVPALINDLNGKLGTLGFPRRFKIEAFQIAQASSQQPARPARKQGMDLPIDWQIRPRQHAGATRLSARNPPEHWQ